MPYKSQNEQSCNKKTRTDSYNSRRSNFMLTTIPVNIREIRCLKSTIRFYSRSQICSCTILHTVRLKK